MRYDHDGGGAVVLAAAQAAAALPGEAIVIAVVGMLGVAATAFGPVLLERAKARQAVVTTPAPPVPASGGAHAAPDPGPDAFDLLEEQIRDLRTQRDAAHARADRLEAEIRDLRRDLTGQIADLSSQLRAAELYLVRAEAARRGWNP